MMAEEMAVMPVKGQEASQIGGLLSSDARKRNRAQLQSRDVTWLPPLERLWHIACRGEAPPQYAHHMCSIITERHPLSGFLRTAIGLVDRA